MINKASRTILFAFLILAPIFIFGQDQHDHSGHDHDQHEHHDHEGHDHTGDHEEHDHYLGDPDAVVTSYCGKPHHGHGKHEASYTDMVMHHIGDANEIHLFGDVHVPLPCILYSKNTGLTVTMSSAFEHGHKVIDGYVLDHGVVRRIACESAAQELQSVSHTESRKEDGGINYYAIHGDREYLLERPAMVYNLGSASWYDLSISKNVAMMMVAVLLMFLVFNAVSKGYQKRDGQAPKGIQSFFEPLFIFMRDEVVKPIIGPKWERYMPFIMSLFFFILFCNLLGLVPFIGGPNITGNVATTLALAVFTFFVVNFSGNKHYWQHILWMPGVPTPVRLLLAPIEIAGLFIKPFTLFIRLFANITAGHILILVLVGLIFIMGNMGESTSGAITGGLIGLPFTFAMNFLELFVAFLQAFVFALLSSIYIGSAVEEHHHDHDHDVAHAH
ncbi:MAG: F0F1 ATP synthase subunit A [Bacteroidota bacterium]